MAVCPEHPDNLIAEWDFSNGFAAWSQDIVQGDGFFTHLSQCGTQFWPNEAAEADYDQMGGGWAVGDEAKIWQDVDASALSGYDRIVLSWAESHHTDLANPGTQVVTLYGSDNQSDWTQLWQRGKVEEAARGAGKNCEELPQFTYVVPVPVTYDYYRLEFHAKVGSTLDGWLFSWVQLYPGTEQTVPAVGATSTTAEDAGRNNVTTVADSITITEAGGVLLAAVGLYDPDGAAVVSSVTLDPGGANEAAFAAVGTAQDVSGSATLRVELWQLANPPAGTFAVQATASATCHNVLLGVQQYGDIDGIGATATMTRTIVNNSGAPPAIRLQPQADGSRIVAASIQRLLATYTAGPEDTIRFQVQSQDGTSVRAATLALFDTPAEQACWAGLEVITPPASVQEWAIVGVELLGVDEGGGTDDLTASDLVAGASVLGTPELDQQHELAVSDLQTAAPALGIPALQQQHTLTASAVVAGSAVAGTPSLALNYSFAPSSVLVGAVSIAVPQMAQGHALAATGIATGQPSLGTPALAGPGTDALATDGIDTAAPVLATPALAQTHAVGAAGVVTGAPDVDEPALAQVYPLAASVLESAAPVAGEPGMAQTHIVTAAGIATGAVVLETPAASQLHVLIPAVLLAGMPLLGTPGTVGTEAPLPLTLWPRSFGQTLVGRSYDRMLWGRSHELTLEERDDG